MDKQIEIELNNAYISGWDNIEFPIFELLDDSYLCIAYSQHHNNYYINTYSKEEFIEEGFEKCAEYNYIFEEILRKDIDR